ncbi:MAG: C25 family cysteine peptidase [Bacteroidales bacterium]|jgi:hypothetical protein|nr:C25 family cysteine peptidase [Bacteroidales bacterium]
MKKFLLSVTFALMCIYSFAQSNVIVLQSSKNGAKQECTKDSFESFQAVFSFEKIESIDVSTEKGAFTAINIEGTYPTGHEGTPQLPSFRQLIAIPQGATPKVVVKSYTEEEYNLTDYSWNKIYPYQPSVRKDMESEDIKFVYKEAAYSVKGYEEREVASVNEIGTMRNIRIGSLTVNPVIYDAGSNTIKVRNNIEVEVIFEGADKTATQSLFESTYSIYFETIYKQFFNKSVYDDYSDLYKTPVYMLVIANRMFEETLEPWISWKTKKGFYMDVNYTDEIGTTNTAIKALCEEKYNEGVANGKTPSFVVLVGDVAQVPASAVGSKTNRQTDLYYSTFDGDYFPDMYYSRMSAQTTQQLENIIEKILYYEQYQFEDPTYLDNVLLIAGADSYWNPRLAQPQMNYANEYYYNEEHGFAEIHKYLSSYTGCYDNLANVGFANYTAHCSETSWGTPSFTVSNVGSLTNENKYFVAMGNCCLAADFGYNECVGEAFIRGQKKGAVGYIGSSPNSYWGEDFHFTVGAYAGSLEVITTPTLENTSDGCYDFAFRDADFNCLSAMVFGGNLSVTHATNMNYTTHIGVEYYWQAYNVLGDGSLMPYWTQGDENVVSHMEIVPIGVDYYEISAVPGSYAAVSKDGVLYGAALVGESGTVQVPLNPPITSGGDVDIVVTRQQYIPYITTLTAAALEGPYIVTDSYKLDGDGVLSYGETAEMELTIKNVGGDPTSSVINVVLTNTDGLANVINGEVEYPSLAVGATATKSGFSFEASKDVDNGQNIYFTAEMTSGSHSWTSNVVVKAHKPVLNYKAFSWQGGFSAGETFDVAVQFINKGGYPVYNVEVDLITNNPDVTINTENVTIANVAVDGIGYAIFNITLSDNISETEGINFTTQASGDKGIINAEGEFTLENKCTLYFEMWDSAGDGWDGNGRISIRQNSVEVGSVKLASGGSGEAELSLPAGELDFVWIYGNSYDYENSFKIYDYSNTLIYQSSGTPTAGSFLLYENTCSSAGQGCESPTNLSAYVDETTVELTWEGEAQSYSILRDGIIIDEVNSTSYTDTNVEDGAHTYYVIAVYTNICSSMPAYCNVIIGDACASPNNLSYVLDNGVKLLWNAPTGLDVNGYNVYKDGVLIAEEIVELYYIDEDVFIGDTYLYKVTAVFDNCESIPVEIAVNYLSVSNHDNNIYVYPNPASDKVIVEGENISVIKIYNSIGQLITVERNAGLIDVSRFKNGIYIFNIETNSAKQVLRKVIINR